MSILDEIVRTKRLELEQLKANSTLEEWKDKANDAAPIRDFLAALKGAPPIRMITEVKKASPSQGIIRQDFDPVSIAEAYERAGASCISVLTDQTYFQGCLDFLQLVRAKVSIPVLRKDFILDPIQVWEARAFGADAVLLIAECLTPDQMRLLYDTISEAGMTALVELYEEKNIEAVLELGPELVGVNNRDLKSFKVDLEHSLRIKQHFDDDQIFVSESGIRSAADAKYLQDKGVDAILVGQSLCEQPDVFQATRDLIQDCLD